MKKGIMVLVVLAVVLSLGACAAGPNTMVGTPAADGSEAGFLKGLWHGFIALFTFIISLFSDKVSVYEVHNNGGWYDLGFIIGVSAFFGGGGNAGKRARSRDRD